MKFDELQALAREIAPILKKYADDAAAVHRAALERRIEDAVGLLVKDMANMSDDIKAVRETPVIVPDAVIEDAIERIKAAIPEPKDGKDGTSVTLEDVQPLIDKAADSLVDRVINLIPCHEDGADGKDGKDADPEVIKAMVAEAVAAIPAAENGSNGQDGRDALQLEIMPAIDEAKSYPRGTYATHNGGLWRAHQKTHGMHGWECIVDGVAYFECEQKDARNYSVVLALSSGKKSATPIRLPTMVYRDVYKPGTQYQKGDVVTFGGCLWHCNEDTEGRPGENTKAWTLCAKKGRDGKSA